MSKELGNSLLRLKTIVLTSKDKKNYEFEKKIFLGLLRPYRGLSVYEDGLMKSLENIEKKGSVELIDDFIEFCMS